MRPLLFVALAACATAPAINDIEDGLDDAVEDGGKDDSAGTTDARAGMLLLANTASFDELQGIGLSTRVAAAITEHRAAEDGLPDTDDDDRFDELRELDLVPRVGPRVVDALTAYADANGFVDRARASLAATIDSGGLRGIFEGGATAYFGIPYAAPPVGELRWRAPEPATAWSDVRDATTRTPGCVQVSTSLGSAGEVIGGREDCLSLDVFRPTGASAPMPVLVFIHGGDFLWGAASDFVQGTYVYDGRHLAMHGAVVVSIDYRLGAFGYLANSALEAADPDNHAGNYGLLDQIAALAWVKHNIAAFGGDPSRVMVFGESAGGCSISYLLASVRATDLFDSAMVESGCHLVWPKPFALAAGDRIARDLGCEGSPDVAMCLRSRSADRVASALPPNLGSGGYTFAPNVDAGVLGDVIERIEAQAHNKVPVIAGTTFDEYTTLIDDSTTRPIRTPADYRAEVEFQFLDNAADVLAMYPVTFFPTPRDAMVAVLTDVAFTCPTRKLLRALDDNQTAPVYRYLYSHTLAGGPDRPKRAGHALDLIFFFGQFGAPSIAGEPTDAEHLLAHRSMNYLVQFAATGDPNGRGAPFWPTYSTANDPYLVLDTPIGRGDHFRNGLCNFWDAKNYY